MTDRGSRARLHNLQTRVQVMESTDLVRVDCPLCGADRNARERELAGYVLTRCQGCGLVFVNPRLSDSALSELYKSMNEKFLIDHYDRVVTAKVIEEYHETLDLMERFLPSRGRLLDYGCAAGHFYEQAATRGWEAHGADVGEWTKEAAGARGLDNLHVGTLADLDFPDHHFDAIHAAQVLEHLPDLKDELGAIRRILRPGGLLYVDVPNYRTLSILLGCDDFLLNMPPQHINYFTPGTLRRLLRQVGFTDVWITTSSGLKWENVLGRNIKEHAAIVNGRCPQAAEAAPAPTDRRRPAAPGMAGRAKKALVDTAIRPVFYKGLKVGIQLIGIARRP